MSEKKTGNEFLVAVDDGYAQIKVAGDALSPDEKSPVLNSFRSSIRHGNIGSLGGEGAIGSYETDEGRTRMTVSDMVAGEPTQFDGFHVSAMDRILVNHALIASGYGGRRVNLWVGLPISDYFSNNGVSKNEAFINRKKNNLRERVKNMVPGGDDVADLVSINVGCQAVSAFIDYAVNDDGEENDVPTERVAVIDIGGRTTDIAMIINGSTYDPERSGTENIGVLDVHTALKSLIHSTFEVNDDYSSTQMDRALRTGKHRMFGKEQDVSKLIEKAVADTTHKLERMIRQKIGSGSDVDAILFTGGGARAFTGISRLYPHNGVVMPDAEFANARGLYKFAKIRS